MCSSWGGCLQHCVLVLVGVVFMLVVWLASCFSFCSSDVFAVLLLYFVSAVWIFRFLDFPLLGSGLFEVLVACAALVFLFLR